MREKLHQSSVGSKFSSLKSLNAYEHTCVLTRYWSPCYLLVTSV